MKTDCEARLDLLEKAVAALGERDWGGEAHAPTDSTWTCAKCGTLLGFYAPGENTVRIKVRDTIVYVTPGPASRVAVTCRKCASLEVLTGEEFEGIRREAIRDVGKIGDIVRRP